MSGTKQPKARVKPTLVRRSTATVPQDNRRKCPVCDLPLENGVDELKFGTVTAKRDGARVIGKYHAKHDDE